MHFGKTVDHAEIVGFGMVGAGFDNNVYFNEHEVDLASWAGDAAFQLLVVYYYAHDSSFCSQYANCYYFGVGQLN